MRSGSRGPRWRASGKGYLLAVCGAAVLLLVGCAAGPAGEAVGEAQDEVADTIGESVDLMDDIGPTGGTASSGIMASDLTDDDGVLGDAEELANAAFGAPEDTFAGLSDGTDASQDSGFGRDDGSTSGAPEVGQFLASASAGNREPAPADDAGHTVITQDQIYDDAGNFRGTPVENDAAASPDPEPSRESEPRPASEPSPEMVDIGTTRSPHRIPKADYDRLREHCIDNGIEGSSCLEQYRTNGGSIPTPPRPSPPKPPPPPTFSPTEDRADAEQMVSQMKTTIADMVASGERRPGSGTLAGIKNNMDAVYLDDQKKRCFDQASRLQQDLYESGQVQTWPPGKMKRVQDKKWWSQIETKEWIPGVTPAGHYRVNVFPTDPEASEVRRIILDPWSDSYEIEYKDGRLESREGRTYGTKRARIVAEMQRRERAERWAAEDAAR